MLYTAERVSESPLWSTNWIHSSWHLRHRQKHHSYGWHFTNEFCLISVVIQHSVAYPGFGGRVGTEGLGTEVPTGVQGQSPGGSLGAKPPEARYPYTICSGQTHFRDVFIEDIWCTFRLMWSLLPPPYSSKKIFEFLPPWSRYHPCPTVATPLPTL